VFSEQWLSPTTSTTVTMLTTKTCEQFACSDHVQKTQKTTTATTTTCEQHENDDTNVLWEYWNNSSAKKLMNLRHRMIITMMPWQATLELLREVLPLFQSTLLGIADGSPKIEDEWLLGKLFQIGVLHCIGEITRVRQLTAGFPNALSCKWQTKTLIRITVTWLVILKCELITWQANKKINAFI